MTAFLNSIAGDEAIKQIEEGTEPDSIPHGYEFGTWEYPPYYTFFRIHGDIPKETPLHNREFTPEEKNKD